MHKLNEARLFLRAQPDQHPRDTMRLTRIRPVGAALVVAACTLLPGVGRPDDTPAAPSPRPVKEKEPVPPPTKPPVESPNEWEAKFAGRSTDDVLAVLSQFAQEWTVRKGGYEVARLRLGDAAGEANKIRAKVAALSPPAATIPLVLQRPADVDAAIKTAQLLADYYATRVQLLDGVNSARAALDARGREFDRTSVAARDHLAAEAAAVRAAKLVPADKLPAPLDPKRLAEETVRLKEASTAAANENQTAKALLDAAEKDLAGAKAAAATAAATLNELKAGREAALDAFAFEEKVRGMTAPILAEEFNRLRKLLAEKTAAIKGDADDYAKATPAVAEARAKLDAVREPTIPSEPAPAASAPALDVVGQKLVAAQQHLAARARTTDERAEKAAALVAALDGLEKKALAYSTTLEDARRIAGHLAAAAAELERRVGRGDLKAADAPDGVAEAAGTAGGRAALDADAAAVRKALGDLRTERDALRKPDTEVENRKALTVVLLGRVNERIDLLTDLKRLAAEYATARKDRPDGEQKRMDQRAAERMARDAEPWSRFFALDHSKPAANLSDLLGAYYKELIDLDEKGENLERQKDRLNKLVDLTRKEAEDVAKLRTLLEKHRTRPEAAEWDDWLAGQLTPGGLKAEADVYHDEVARLAAVGGANARRVAALTGNPPPEKPKSAADQTQLAATGGEIGQARAELLEARVRGLSVTGIKIGAVLLAALLVPPVLMFVLRRAIRGGTDAAGNLSPVLAALRGALKIGTWVAATALILSVLGYDVTALVGGLAIGVLAIALAARPMIADVLGSVVIFAERRFQVGDVVRLGGGDPARVVGLTWRSTALKNTAGLVVSVPNRKVTEGTVENLSRGTETYDALAVTISTDKDAGKVIGVIRAALAQCKNLSPADQGVTVLKFNQKGPVKVVEYRFWWFLKDYEVRNKTRDEVFARIAVGLAHEDMTGIEVTLA